MNGLASEEQRQQDNRNVMVYAGFWRRVLAGLIDAVIVSGVPNFIIGFYIGFAGVSKQAEATIDTFWNISSILLIWVYYALMESSAKQATLGKMAIGIVVTDLDGARISFGRATGRHFGKFFSGLILFIGFIMAGFTGKKQALHDMMANCLVVKKQ